MGSICGILPYCWALLYHGTKPSGKAFTVTGWWGFSSEVKQRGLLLCWWLRNSHLALCLFIGTLISHAQVTSEAWGAVGEIQMCSIEASLWFWGAQAEQKQFSSTLAWRWPRGEQWLAAAQGVAAKGSWKLLLNTFRFSAVSIKDKMYTSDSAIVSQDYFIDLYGITTPAPHCRGCNRAPKGSWWRLQRGEPHLAQLKGFPQIKGSSFLLTDCARTTASIYFSKSKSKRKPNNYSWPKQQCVWNSFRLSFDRWERIPGYWICVIILLSLKHCFQFSSGGVFS